MDNMTIIIGRVKTSRIEEIYFLSCVFGWEDGKVERCKFPLFGWEKKNERMKNVTGINLLSSPKTIVWFKKKKEKRKKKKEIQKKRM